MKIKKQVTGYELRYSKKSNMKKAKTIKIKKGSIVEKEITGLKEGTKYYFEIRSYKTVSGKKYYSDWSSTKKCKTQKDTSTSNASTPTTKTTTSNGGDDSGGSGKVWVTANGTKYHKKKTCSRMKNPYEIDIEQAKKLGYTPCSKCY